jgi:uncharacterized lipoprotein YajG
MQRRQAQNARIVRLQAVSTLLLLALLALLAACGSSSTKVNVTPVPPTATPPPKRWNAVISPLVGSEGNLTAVAALSASDVCAVGDYSHAYGSQQSLIKRYIA